MAELGVAWVSILPDTSKLAPGIKTAMGAAADDAATKAGDSSGKTFGSRFSGAVSGALKTAAKTGLVAAGAAAGVAILGGVKSAIDQDKAEATLAGLYGSAKTASKLMADLKRVASTSTIDYSTYTKAAQALAYLGVSGKDAPEMLENIGDAIAGAGGGAEEMDRAGDALLKMVNAGKVELDTLNQLSDAGVPIYSALASQQGKSIAKVREMVTAGKLGIEDVQKAIADAEGASFKKQIASAKKVEKTLSGRFSILKDNVTTALGSMFRPGIDAAADFVGSLNKTLFEGGGLRSKLSGLASGVDLSQFTRTWGAIKQFFVGLMPAIRSVAGQFRDALGPAVKSIGRAFTEDFLPGIRAILPVIRPVVSFVIRFVGGALVGAFKGAVQVISGALQTIGGIFRLIRAVVTGQWGKAWDALKSIASGVMNAIVGAIKVWWNLGIIAMFRRGILLVLKPFGKMFGRLLGLAKGGAKKVTGALQPIVAFLRKVLGKAFTWLWRKAVQPAFRGIGKVAGWLWSKALKPTFGFIGKGVALLWKGVKSVFASWRAFFTKVLFPVIRFLWSKVVKPVFGAVKKGVGLAWTGIKTYLSAWRAFFTKVLFPAIRFLWSKVVRPVFGKVGDLIGSVWNNVARPAFSALRKGFGKVGDAVKWVWNKVLRPPLDAFKSILDEIAKAVGWLLENASKLKDAIPDLGDIAGGLKGGVGKLKFWSTGGLIVGPGSGTSDSIPAMVSNGEFIVRAAAVRKYGPQLFDALNRGTARVRRYASGGLVGSTLRLNQDNPLATAIRSLVATLRDRVVPALLKPSPTRVTRAPRLDPTPKGRTNVGADTALLRGFGHTAKRSADVLGGTSFKPMLKEFQKGTKNASKWSRSMELAVGKSAKKMGRYWTAYRRGPVQSTFKDWSKKTKQAARDGRTLDKSTSTTAKRMGNTLKGFRAGALSTFSKDFRRRFRTDAPADAGTFRSKVTEHVGATSRNIRSTWNNGIKPTLRTFGTYPKQTVAPLFAKGTDAIGTAWSKVEGKSKKPIRFVIETVLNRGLVSAFNKIAKFVDAKKMPEIGLPRGFRIGGYTGRKPRNAFAGFVHGDEYVIRSESQREIEKYQPGFLDRLNKHGVKALPGHRRGGKVASDPDRRVYYDGEPIAAVAAAQLLAAERLTGTAIHLMQGGWQPATSYSGTSHQYPGVADTSPGTFGQQAALERVGMHGWARNIPGAAYAGSGAHIHSLSRFSPGTAASPQWGTGDGLGGADYGPRPPLIPGIKKRLEAQFGALPTNLGSGAPMLPPWVSEILTAPKKWAASLLDGGERLAQSRLGELTQATLLKLAGPVGTWASDTLGPAAYSGPASGSVTRFTPIVKKVLRSLGEPAGPTLVGAVLARMQQESGGNIGIVNKWDSNWRAGHPSVGLMQVIGPTYQSNKPRPDRGPYKYGTSIDPYSNIYAGLHYARGRYPSIYYGMTKPGGYDLGGLARGVGFMRKDVLEPERVLKPRETVAFERMVAANFAPAAAHGDAGPVDVTITNWETGKAVMRRSAAAEIGVQRAHARTVGRQVR